MEDEVKEDPTRPNEDPTRSKETMSTWKAGWVKKASGRFLASYKDRYIQVERTELVVYENEDLATYLEKVDLENYDKCHELRSAFTKKNRLVLIRAAKSGNKVHDVKFQAQNPEEKEAWIKAFSDGINRAKNKIFDEVKVDETSQLEHATRTRPKGNRNRRPPTRIHMKEVANVSSDGILRHDLDVVDASIPNGTHQITTDTTETPKKSVKPPMPPTSKPSEAPEECQTTQSPDEGLPSETEPSPQKVLKPPMPPSKEAETAAAFAGDQLPDETSTDRSPEKKVLKPPMPPSKEAKPTVSAEDQPPGETSPEKKVLKTPMPPSKEAKPTAPAGDQPPRNTSPEGSPEQGFESAPPPTPPGKPIGGSTDNLAKASQSSQEHRPPTPPSKDKKPTQTAVQESTKEASGMRKKGEEDEVEEKEEEGSETIASDVQQSSILEGAEDEESPSSQLTTPMTPLEVKVEPSVTDHPEVTTTTLEEETQKVAKPMAQEQESAPSGGVDISPNEEPQTMKSSQLTVTPSVQTPEPIKKSPGPPRPPTKKKPVVLPPPKAVVVPQDVHLSEPKNQATDKTKNIIITTTPGEKLNSITSPTPAMVTTTSPTEETEDLKVPVVVETKSEFPVVVLSLSDPEPDSSCSSPMSCHLSPEKKSEREEEKSVDSGQHSDIDVDEEWSESRDTLAASTAALMGSQAGLDALMDEDGDTENPGSLGLSTVEDCPSTTQTPQDNHSGLHSTFLQMRVSQASHCPPIPFKPLAKLMSTSLGDLLSEASLGENMKQPITDVSVTKATVGPQNLTDLENEVALKLENTEELLGSVVPKGSTEVGQNSALAEGNSLEDRSPEELLARAMEKLRKADQFLRQAKHIKDSKHSENTAKRNSW